MILAFYDTNYKEACFDIQNGTLGAKDTAITSTIESVGDGWFRCSIYYDANTREDPYLSFGLSPTNTAAFYTGAGTNRQAYVWGAQINNGTLKPYFPTTDRQNVPRLTYEGGCPSLLLEPQRTNLVTYSEAFDNADWSKFALDIVANDAISPEGVSNASFIRPTTANSAHQIYKTFSISAGTNTLSLFLKAGNYSKFRFYFYDGTTAHEVYGDCSDGSIYSTNSTAKVENYGNGWYRYSVTATNVAFSSGNYTLRVVNSSYQDTWAGNGTDGLYIYGWQFEAGSYVSSYIPTTSAAVTRVADECYKTGISSLIGQTEGTLFFECTNKSLVNQARYFLLSDGGFNNRIDIFQFSENNLGLYVATSGVAQVSVTNVTLPSSGSFKFAVAYANNDYAWYLNGTQIGTDTSASVPTLTNALFALNAAGGTSGGSGNSPFKQAALFKTRLTNTELAALTTL